MKKQLLLGTSCLAAFLVFGVNQAKAEVQNRSVVTTADELKSALADDNGITEVILANDIQITSGIHVNANKKELVIDGQGHTLTENASSTGSSTANIYISDANGVKDIQLKNIDIVGKNYYGIIQVGTSNVTYNVENVTYTGPQFMYNPYGYANFSGTNNFTIQESTGTALMEEFAEVSGVTIDGEFNLTTYTTGAYSAFWFDHSVSEPPTFNVKEGAKVNIDSKARQIFYAWAKTNFSIGNNAEVEISTPQPMFDAGWIGNFTLGENANFTINRFAQNWLDYPTLRVDGELNTMKGATLVVNHAAETAAPALEMAAYSYLNFDAPKLVDLATHGNAKAIEFDSTSFSFNAGTVSEWVGNETDTPTFAATDLEAILSVEGMNKKVVYSNQPDVFKTMSITNANRLQFKN